MKTAAVVDDVQYVATSNVMHTKQLAEHWGVDPRSLTNWIAKVRKSGYQIGTSGERNRTYYNDVDQDLIKAARYGTLTKNPNSKKVSETSENVLSMEDRRAQELEQEQLEASQNRNLELTTQIAAGGGLLATRKQEAYQQGVAIATAEFGEKVRGYLETRVQAEQAFNDFVKGLNPVQGEEVEAVEIPSPKQLVAALF